MRLRFNLIPDGLTVSQSQAGPNITQTKWLYLPEQTLRLIVDAESHTPKSATQRFQRNGAVNCERKFSRYKQYDIDCEQNLSRYEQDAVGAASGISHATSSTLSIKRNAVQRRECMAIRRGDSEEASGTAKGPWDQQVLPLVRIAAN